MLRWVSGPRGGDQRTDLCPLGGANVILWVGPDRLSCVSNEEVKTMRTFVIIAAALGLSVSGASAECGYNHSKVSASVDTQTTTASVVKADMSKATDTQTVVKKEVPPKTE
ncbi:Uncharacterized protein MLTONO_0472 [Mesorhizobium loti]|nr:Uncharacterized protein MLTONO_0472 [Mesorhizobium loti]